MKFKKYFIIFALFFMVLCSVGTISAVSNDTMENIASQADFDDAVSLSNDDESIALDNQDSKVNAQKDDENLSQSFKDDEILTASVNSQGDDKLSASSSKSNLQITNYTNFVKSGNKYYFYLKDSNGKTVPNKKLTINLDGKNYQRTTNTNGRVGITIKSSNPSSSMTISYEGDSQYKAFSKKLNIYIDQSFTMNIGNSKLLTNGYLRIYLSGPRDLVANKTVKITIGSKKYSKKTSAEGFIIMKPKLSPNKYYVAVQYDKYVTSKKIKCIAGNVRSPYTTSIPTVNGVPDIDLMPSTYVMADNYGKYTLLKSQYQETLKRDSYCLYLYSKLPKYVMFKSKDSPKVKHIIKRENWNVIERALNTKLVKKNKYEYWPSSITVSLNGKSYTYAVVRDIQNTGYTCGPTAASVCSQALKKYYSEKFFQEEADVVDGVNIPVLKSAIDRNGFKTSYFYYMSEGVSALKKGGTALIAFLRNHYVAVLDVSPDGKKILVSNSYGDYDVGGDNRVPTDWVSLSYFNTKFQGIGLIVKLNYKLSTSKKTELNYLYSNLGANWNAQNLNERIPDVGL